MMVRVNALLRYAASHIGPIRQLIDQRDRLLVENGRISQELARLQDRNRDLDDRISSLAQEVAALTRKVSDPVAAGLSEPPAPLDRNAYERWFQEVFGVYGTAPNTFPATSWPLADIWGAQVNAKMVEVEEEFAGTLLAEIQASNVPGIIVEFGVFRGDWLLRLVRACERLGLQRQIVGFDSFEGLPAPSADNDLDCWAEGDYAASLEEVAERLDVTRRRNISLIKGWFSDSLKTDAAQAIRDIALARVDCDLYGACVECLDYLAGRLSDRSILVFDDWTFDLQKGETKAFREWVSRVPQYRFEFLCYNSIGHLYLRVHHVAKQHEA